MKRTLKITKTASGLFCVDEPSVPGSPPVGHGNTVLAAIGSWVVHHQESLGLSFDTSEIAQTESRRQQRELNKR